MYRFIAAQVMLLIFWGNISGNHVHAEESGNTPRNFSFCYQDVELYPNYTGVGTEAPLTNPGVNVELVQLAAQASDMTVSFVRYPWKRCLALLKLGRIDSVIASYRKERLDSLVYPMTNNQPDASRLITLSGYYLYQRRGTSALWDGQAFVDTNAIIGAPLGYSITAALREQGLNIVETGTTESLLHMLLYGRLQAVAAPGAAANTLLRQNAEEFSAIEKVEAPIRINHYFIAFSHAFFDKYRDAANKIWQASPNVYRENMARLQMKYSQPASGNSQP